jgi:hypothetical protein
MKYVECLRRVVMIWFISQFVQYLCQETKKYFNYFKFNILPVWKVVKHICQLFHLLRHRSFLLGATTNPWNASISGNIRRLIPFPWTFTIEKYPTVFMPQSSKISHSNTRFLRIFSKYFPIFCGFSSIIWEVFSKRVCQRLCIWIFSIENKFKVR